MFGLFQLKNQLFFTRELQPARAAVYPDGLSLCGAHLTSLCTRIAQPDFFFYPSLGSDSAAGLLRLGVICLLREMKQ